ncbi:hypothetical protein ACJDT4_10660 [Clostridium neuense]|uniref:Uncharacterized protein n=1 Tax=Clostridium neuense TaxID=1728934 RepID=A0ABW8TGR5_9CLOT
MLERLDELVKWSVKNKEWLFSGAGISIIGIISFVLKKIFNTNKNDNIKSININYNNNNFPQKSSQSNNEQKDDINNDMLKLVDRFISVYTNHGILVNQICFYINPDFQLKLSDFKDKDSILQILDDKIINWTCKMFNVQREWIDGKSNRIYASIDYYKRITVCIKKLVELKNLYNEDLEIYFIKNGDLNPNVFGKSYVIIIFKYAINKFNNSPIYKYIPIKTMWDWGHWRSRYQLKSIIYFCEKLGLNINGYDMPLDVIENISMGIVFPELEIDKIPINIWYPEDYIDYETENVEAKEVQETDSIMQYIKDEGYLKYFYKIQQDEKNIILMEN